MLFLFGADAYFLFTTTCRNLRRGHQGIELEKPGISMSKRSCKAAVWLPQTPLRARGLVPRGIGVDTGGRQWAMCLNTHV